MRRCAAASRRSRPVFPSLHSLANMRMMSADSLLTMLMVCFSNSTVQTIVQGQSDLTFSIAWLSTVVHQCICVQMKHSRMSGLYMKQCPMLQATYSTPFVQLVDVLACHMHSSSFGYMLLEQQKKERRPPTFGLAVPQSIHPSSLVMKGNMPDIKHEEETRPAAGRLLNLLHSNNGIASADVRFSLSSLCCLASRTAGG